MQSDFTAGRSTIDAILVLRLWSELHREFDRSLNLAYLDIKAAFDSVVDVPCGRHCAALVLQIFWQISSQLCMKTPELKYAAAITCPTDFKPLQEWNRAASLCLLYSYLRSIGFLTTCPQNQASVLVRISSMISSMQTTPHFSSRMHHMPLNACLASTSHPQCLACVSHGPKPNFSTWALMDTDTRLTLRWMETLWSKLTIFTRDSIML